MSINNSSVKICSYGQAIIMVFCSAVLLISLVACSESDADSKQDYPIALYQTNADGQYGAVVDTDWSGDTLVVSATGRNGSEEPGTVFIYAVNDMSSTQSLSQIKQAELSSSKPGNSAFGYDVSISADGMTVAVGAPAEEDTVSGVNGIQNDGQTCYGTVYIYSRPNIDANWIQESFIRANIRYILNDSTIRQDCTGFGLRAKLSSDGKTLGVVGERAIFVYEKIDELWQEIARLTPEKFDGYSVDIDIETDKLAVGLQDEALQESSSNFEKGGVVYIYSRTDNDWQQSAMITANNGEANDHFGSSVVFGRGTAVNGINPTSFLVVGAPGEASVTSGVDGDQSNNTMPGAGAVYVFENIAGEWDQTTYIKPENPSAAAGFGSAVDANHDSIFVGAPLATVDFSVIDGEDAKLGNGAVYGFQLYAGEWIQSDYLTVTNATSGDRFGYSVAVSSFINLENSIQIAVGAPFTNDESGTVFVY